MQPAHPKSPLDSRRSPRLTLVLASAALTGTLLLPMGLASPKDGAAGLPAGSFVPLATYQVSGEDPVAEIVDVTPDGNYLLYTNSEEGRVGVVDITDPVQPAESALVDVAGTPTSVAITPDGRYALVGVYEGFLAVLDLTDLAQTPHWIDLGGQPDSIAISSDGQFAAVAIENERNEDLNDGEMPQDPPGWLSIVDLNGPPSQWALREVNLQGVADRFSQDPEPEFVSINHANVAAVTLQENNFVVLVALASGEIMGGFSTGTTTHRADLQDDDQIQFTDWLVNARREPDAIGWTPRGNLVTANEGDYDLDLAEGQFVGGRNFSIFSPDGELLFDAGAELEEATVAAGLYPDSRSDAKGVEPEGIEIARYLNHTYLFVGMERAATVAVYRLDGNESRPKFIQILATGSRPEGLLAIPQRGLFVTANEGDGTLSIFGAKPGRP